MHVASDILAEGGTRIFPGRIYAIISSFKRRAYFLTFLVGGFHHLEKYDSQWEGLHTINEMENKTCLKPPTRFIR